ADVRGLQQHRPGQLPLHSNRILLDVGVLQLRIDCADATLQASVIRRARADVAQVRVVELDILQVWLDVHLTETDVAFRPVVEQSKAAAHRSLIVRRIGKAYTRSESPVHLEETA